MSTDDNSQAVISAATELSTDPARAETWFYNEPIRELGNKTPAQLVQEGRTADVLRYISLIEAGFLG